MLVDAEVHVLRMQLFSVTRVTALAVISMSTTFLKLRHFEFQLPFIISWAEVSCYVRTTKVESMSAAEPLGSLCLTSGQVHVSDGLRMHVNVPDGMRMHVNVPDGVHMHSHVSDGVRMHAVGIQHALVHTCQATR